MIIKKKLSKRDKEDFLHKEEIKFSRRDFVGRTLASGAAILLAPSVTQVASNRVFGAECPPASSGDVDLTDMIPFIELHGGGGGDFKRDTFMFGDGLGASGSWRNLGLPDDNDFAGENYGDKVSTDYGIGLHRQGALYAGLEDILEGQDEIKNRIDSYAIPSRTRSDNSGNQLSAVHAIVAAGRVGALKPTLGNRSLAESESGARHRLAAGTINNAFAPVVVRRASDARSIGGAGGLFARLTQEKSEKVLKAISQLSSAKLAQFHNMTFAEQIEQLDKEGAVKKEDLIKGSYKEAECLPFRFSEDNLYPENPDAATDQIAQAFSAPNRNDNEGRTGPGSGATSDETAEGKLAGSVHLILSGYVGAGALQLPGGYDNHNGTAVDPWGRRREMGRAIGRSLLAAHLYAQSRGLTKPFMIYVSTDGGMGNNGEQQITATINGTNQTFNAFRCPGDNENNSMLVFVYHPTKVKGEFIEANHNPANGSPEGRQVGVWTSGGASRDALPLATDITGIPENVLLNYLALHYDDPYPELEKVIGRNRANLQKNALCKVFKKA